MGIDFGKDFTEAEFNAWWDLHGGGQMAEINELEKEFSPQDFPEKAEELLTPKQAKKRTKKGKKSLHKVRVDNARRRGR